MRHAIVDEAAVETGRTARPDPYGLPVSYPLPHPSGPASARASATIDRDRTTVRRSGRGEVSLPVRAYRGVAVRMEANEDDRLAVILELNHEDPELSLPLMIAEDPAEIVADWQAWSRSLGLPMLLLELDGTLSEPVPHLGAVAIQAPRPRRRHSYFAARRPRFLVRRKTGWRGGVEKIETVEIIARS